MNIKTAVTVGKTVVGALGGFGTGYICRVLTNSIPTKNRFEKFAVSVGGFLISGVIGEQMDKYLDRKANALIDILDKVEISKNENGTVTINMTDEKEKEEKTDGAAE